MHLYMFSGVFLMFFQLYYALLIIPNAIAIITDAINPLRMLEILYCGIKSDAAYNMHIFIIRLKNPSVSIFIGIATNFKTGFTKMLNSVITAAIGIAYQKLSIEIPGI